MTPLIRTVTAGALAMALAVFPAITKAAPFFVDWISADLTTNVATGNLGGVTVTLTAGDLTFAVTNNSSNVWANTNYTPSLALSDYVEFIGHGVAPYSNSVTFSAPVTDIVLHIHSLASVLTFTRPDNSPITVNYVSGSLSNGTISGNSVAGLLSNSGPSICPSDVCGTVTLLGTFTGFNFTSYYYTWPGSPALPIDGIGIHIGANVETVPAPGALTLLGLGVIGFGALRRKRT